MLKGEKPIHCNPPLILTSFVYSLVEKTNKRGTSTKILTIETPPPPHYVASNVTHKIVGQL